MIALRDGLPLIALPDGRNTSFDKRWVTASLQKAAEQAGYHRWWLAEHIAESVAVYLKRDYEENCVPVISLQAAVLDVLENLGFSDVAGYFRLPDPPLNLSLVDLVREAGDGYKRNRREVLREEIVSFIRQHGQAVVSTRQKEPLEIQLS